MNNFDTQYISLIGEVLKKGFPRIVRSGAKTFSIHGHMIKHDLAEGFPLTTLRGIPLRLVASELEWCLKGKTDKRWLQERGNHIWDKPCNPKKIPYHNDAETLDRMKRENDLGPIYGFQWRHFGAAYPGCDSDRSGGFEQIESVIDHIKTKPFSKSLLVSSWNLSQAGEMAIPPCPFAFQIIRHGDNLNLSFFQRSVDCIVGLPFDFAFYALLLHLFCLQTGLAQGSVCAFFSNVEIFEQHVEGARTLLARQPLKLPTIKTEGFTNINMWKYTDSAVEGYSPHPQMKFEVNI